MTKMMLYKKDTKGNIRYLDIKSEGDKIIQRSGIVGTENEVEHVKVAKSKNIGKANATTAEHQAVLEVASILTSKLKEGYFYSIADAEEQSVVLPMLAKSYKDEFKKIDWTNCYVQPKLDGQRCLAHIKKDGSVTLISRDGRVIENMNHIIEELSDYKEDIIFDGELYAHGLSFQENMKLIKKYREGETEKVCYNVYDVVEDDSFTNRFMSKLIKWSSSVLFVDTEPVKSEEELKSFHIDNLKEGYEGSIIRWGDAPYKVNGRSSNLLKYKDFQDIDATIVDITPAEQRPEWGIPTLEYNGKRFRAGLKYSHEDRKDFLINKDNYIGKIANIRFFEYTDEGLPRFPVMVGIHADR